jgi:hypothetical protein
MNKSTTASKGLKKALLIGINYIESPSNKLAGCINDVKNIKKQINKFYPKCKQFKILTDDLTLLEKKPTRKNIIDGINWLVKGLKPGDNVYFHYSGHGGLTVDKNNDEKSGMDNCIYPIRDTNIEMILDDELKQLLANKIPKGSKCFAVLDCCHSGSGLDLRVNIQCPSYGKLIVSQENYERTNGSVIFLSGCMDSQTSEESMDSKGELSGALTNALIEVWNTYGMNIKFKHLLWDIRKILSERKYEQIPQISCGNTLDIKDIFSLN